MRYTNIKYDSISNNIFTISKRSIVFFIVIVFLLGCQNNAGSFNNYRQDVESPLQKLRTIGIMIPFKEINAFNHEGRRTGWWITENSDYLSLTYYINGSKDGIELDYNSRMKPITLLYILIYSNDNITDIISFNELGELSSITYDFKVNRDFPEFKNTFKYLGYHKYYKNGRLQEEGLMLFQEDWQLESEKIGNWKYYRDDGTFIIKNMLPYCGSNSKNHENK